MSRSNDYYSDQWTRRGSTREDSALHKPGSERPSSRSTAIKPLYTRSFQVTDLLIVASRLNLTIEDSRTLGLGPSKLETSKGLIQTQCTHRSQIDLAQPADTYLFTAHHKEKGTEICEILQTSRQELYEIHHFNQCISHWALAKARARHLGRPQASLLAVNLRKVS